MPDTETTTAELLSKIWWAWRLCLNREQWEDRRIEWWQHNRMWGRA